MLHSPCYACVHISSIEYKIQTLPTLPIGTQVNIPQGKDDSRCDLVTSQTSPVDELDANSSGKQYIHHQPLMVLQYFIMQTPMVCCMKIQSQHNSRMMMLAALMFLMSKQRKHQVYTMYKSIYNLLLLVSTCNTVHMHTFAVH